MDSLFPRHSQNPDKQLPLVGLQVPRPLVEVLVVTVGMICQMRMPSKPG